MTTTNTTEPLFGVFEVVPAERDMFLGVFTAEGVESFFKRVCDTDLVAPAPAAEDIVSSGYAGDKRRCVAYTYLRTRYTVTYKVLPIGINQVFEYD